MKGWIVLAAVAAVSGAAGAAPAWAQEGTAPSRQQMLEQLTRPDAAADDDMDVDCSPGSPQASWPVCQRRTRGWTIPGSRPTPPRPPVTPPDNRVVTAPQPSPRTPRRPPPVRDYAQAAAQCAPTEVSGGGLNLCVTFALGSTQLTPTSRQSLDTLASILTRELQGRRVMIEGHADARGRPDTNRTLSKQRADAVVRYLTARGVSASQLAAEGFGADRPITGRDGADPMNRRVQARLVG